MEVLTESGKRKIGIVLRRVLFDKKKQFESVSRWGDDAVGRVLGFITEGKMVRGQLVLFSNTVFGGPADGDTLRVAAALELMHGMLLIHDDVMDRDGVRRGKPTMYAVYRGMASGKNIRDPEQFGMGMAVCVGDALGMVAMELLAALDAPKEIQARLMSRVAHEISLVTVAQMQDIAAGLSRDAVAEDEIIRCYRFKTARYTFSLPLAAGAILRGQPSRITRSLWNIGENMGILFQIADDRLGVFGDSAATGKGVGSDIREGKKTLYYHFLRERLPSKEKNGIMPLFGKTDLTGAEVGLVRDAISTYGIDDEINIRVSRLVAAISAAIDGLPIRRQQRDALKSFTEFLSNRRK